MNTQLTEFMKSNGVENFKETTTPNNLGMFHFPLSMKTPIDNILNIQPEPTEEVVETVEKKKTYLKPNQLFNSVHSLPNNIKTLNRGLEVILHIKEVSREEKLVISNIYDDIQSLIIPKISNPYTQVRNCIKGFEKINPNNIPFEIIKLRVLVNDLMNPTYEKPTINKPTISVSQMKKVVIETFSKFNLGGFEEEKSIIIIDKFENSNQYTKIVYSYIKQKLFTGKDLVEKVYSLVKDFKSVNSTNVTGLVGNKTESTIQKNIYRTIDNNHDLDLSDRLVVTFGGGLGEVLNFYPLIYDKDYKLVVNFFENTPYQFHIDLLENTEELKSKVGEIETRYRKFTKNFTLKGEDIEFCKLIRTELNELEEQGVHNIDTSSRYMFISTKIFGGNISWKNNLTRGSFGTGRKIQKSILSKIDYGKYILESFKSVEIRNESFEVIYQDYNEVEDFHSNDPLYVLKNGLSMKYSTRTDYGIENFPHKLNFEMFMDLKSENKIYHNYPNGELIKLSKNYNVVYDIVEKNMKNGRVNEVGEEIIISTVTKHKSVINPNYTPQSETLLVS
jgi:hypothetical protein